MNILKKYTSVVLSILLGFVLLSSASLKLKDMIHFEEVLASYGWEYLSYAAPFIILIEFFLGLHLFFLIRIKQFAFLNLILVSFFTIAYSYGLLFKDITNCGCFGNLWTTIFDIPIVLYLKNFIILGISYIILKSKKQFDNVEIQLRRTVVYLIFASTIYLVGFKFNPIVYISNQKENTLINETIEELSLDSVYPFSADSTYMVVIFSYGCPHCLNSIANANLYKKNNYVNQTIFIPYGNKEARKKFNKDFNLIGYRLNDNLNKISKIVKAFPTTLFIKNNNIIFVHEGFIPSPIIFFRKNKL